MRIHLKIGTRLGLGFGVLLAFLLALGGVCLNRMSVIQNNMVEILDHYRVQEDLTHTMAWQVQLVAGLVPTVLSAPAAERKSFNDQLVAARNVYAEAGRKLESSLRSAEAKALFAKVQGAREAAIEANNRVLEASMAGREQEAARIMFTEARPATQHLLEDMEALVVFFKKATLARYQAAKASYRQTQYLTIGIAILALAAGAALSFSTTQTITRPLASLGRVLATVAQGDLTQRVEIHSQDELGDLGRVFNSTNQGLCDMVVQIQESAHTISAASSELSEGNLDLSHRTEKQAASLEETASSMEQITSNVQQTADNARAVSEESIRARKVVEEGGAAVSQVVAAMEAINQSSARINEIIGVVDEIAFQTNLLALNAAVEAARAGEQGRGFAVVAAEVRNLAKRSADAAKEIKGLIRESVANSKEGTKVAAQAGDTIHEVVGSVQRVTDLVGRIADATLEQSIGLREINQALAQMDEVTQQTAALLEESAAASEAMDAQARSLTDALARFRTGAALRQPSTPKARSSSSPQARPAPAPRSTPRAVDKSAPMPAKPSVKRSPARPELAIAKQPVATPPSDDDGQWEAF